MPKRTPEDFTAEVDAHLQIEIDRLVAEGMTPKAARAAAIKAFGSPTRARENFYEKSRWVWLEQFVQDLRYALRGLRAQPAFLATTVLTLAAGLSVVTIVFTVFNAYVLRPFAIRDPYAMHSIQWRATDNGSRQFRWQDYLALRERTDLFDGVVAQNMQFVTSGQHTLATSFVSTNYFEVLGPRMLLGRPLAAVDERAPVAVLSYDAWKRLYDGDRSVIGRELDVEKRPFTIVGVMGPEFSSLDDLPRDFWAPLTTYAELFGKPGSVTPQGRQIEVTARLRRGVTAAQVESALAAVMPQMVDESVDRKSLRAHLELQATPNPVSLQMIAVLSPVFAAFGLVLVTACANVSNVMLSRAIARQREIALRLSLGASRGRVVRQLLTEGLLVAVTAAAAALVISYWTLRVGLVVFFAALPPSFAARLRIAPLDFDHRVYLFALSVATVTTLLFALVPALQGSRLALTDALRGHRTGTARGSKLRGAMVVAQVAVSIVLVIAALTAARNGRSVERLDVGFETKGVTSINVRGEDDVALVARLHAALEADARVESVAVTNSTPFIIQSRPVPVAADGANTAPVSTRYTFVAPQYFPLLRIPIAGGRAFRDDEAASAAAVAIVSRATARTLWPGQDPIGRAIRIGDRNPLPDGLPRVVTVVGVAPDVISGFPIDGPDSGHVYLPVRAGQQQATSLLVRSRDGRALGSVALGDRFRQVTTDPQVLEPLPLDEVRQAVVFPLRMASLIGGILGGLAVALSVSGLYGVLAYTLAQRTREIGIRMALGATAGAVIRLVMRESVRLTGIGMAVGLTAVFAAVKVLSAFVQFREISLLDVAAFAGGAAIVAAAAALAAYRPARRATRIDPAETLRAEA